MFHVGPSKGNEGRLFCAGADLPANETSNVRSDVQVLLDRLPEPIDLDFDRAARALYLTDRGDPPLGNSISRIQLGGSGRVESKKIIVRKLHEAIGLTLDVKNQNMYFTDLNGSVYRSRMDGSEEVELFKEMGDLTGVACLHD
jgi:hypothetical protein